MRSTRRDFLRQATAAGTGVLLGGAMPHAAEGGPGAGPIAGPLVIASGNGLAAVSRAMELINTGADALDAVIAGVNLVEDDPTDHSVGYGGLPNEDGIVELDAAVMHGPTHRGGAVAALRNIKNPSKVAKLVLERTDHVLIVGEGALRFARAHGFKEEDLLTDEAREIWLRWKENMSTKDDRLPPHTPETPEKEIGEARFPRPEIPGVDKATMRAYDSFFRLTGTIHCSAIDRKGSVSCVTTTSGLSFKIPGRVGDSPILGAGLYVDNAVGAAGSTGRGEANLVNCSSVMIVEWMRAGKSPEEACLEACRRIVSHNVMRRLQRDDGRPAFDVKFYALNVKGEFGGAGIYSGGLMAVHDGTAARRAPMAFLYEKPSGG
jgi:N4-(beta-N-acetylglucosaminyl)-L-asparaginase